MNLTTLLVEALSVPNKRTLVVFKGYKQAQYFNDTFIKVTDVPCKLRELIYKSVNDSIVILGKASTREEAFQRYCGMTFHSIIIIDSLDLSIENYLISRLRGTDPVDAYTLYRGTVDSLHEVYSSN